MKLILIIALFFLVNSVVGQNKKTIYLDFHGNEIVVPLGEISFADKVVEYEVGEFKSIEKGFKGINPTYSLGEPDVKREYIYEKSNKNMTVLGCRGTLVVEFTDNAIINVEGPDIFIFEVGTIEDTELSISKDLSSWIDIGKINGGTASVDIEDFVKDGELFYFIKLKDLGSDCDGFSPGADIDAIAAIGSTDKEVIIADNPKYNEEYKFRNSKITVKIWDNAREDGDVINVYLNKDIIVRAEEVKKKPIVLEIDLDQQVNLFEIEAINEGEMSPNTAALEITDGEEVYAIILSSKKGEKKTLQFIKE